MAIAFIHTDIGTLLSEGGGNSQEHLPHVQSTLGRSLVVQQVFVLHELLNLLRGDLTFSIGLIADQDEQCVGVGVALNLVDPVIADVEEGVA